MQDAFVAWKSALEELMLAPSLKYITAKLRSEYRTHVDEVYKTTGGDSPFEMLPAIKSFVDNRRVDNQKRHLLLNIHQQYLWSLCFEFWYRYDPIDPKLGFLPIGSHLWDQYNYSFMMRSKSSDWAVLGGLKLPRSMEIETDVSAVFNLVGEGLGYHSEEFVSGNSQDPDANPKCYLSPQLSLWEKHWIAACMQKNGVLQVHLMQRLWAALYEYHSLAEYEEKSDFSDIRLPVSLKTLLDWTRIGPAFRTTIKEILQSCIHLKEMLVITINTNQPEAAKLLLESFDINERLAIITDLFSRQDLQVLDPLVFTQTLLVQAVNMPSFIEAFLQLDGSKSSLLVEMREREIYHDFLIEFFTLLIRKVMLGLGTAIELTGFTNSEAVETAMIVSKLFNSFDLIDRAALCQEIVRYHEPHFGQYNSLMGVHRKWQKHWSPVHIAVAIGDMELAAYLLRLGENYRQYDVIVGLVRVNWSLESYIVHQSEANKRAFFEELFKVYDFFWREDFDRMDLEHFSKLVAGKDTIKVKWLAKNSFRYMFTFPGRRNVVRIMQRHLPPIFIMLLRSWRATIVQVGRGVVLPELRLVSRGGQNCNIEILKILRFFSVFDGEAIKAMRLVSHSWYHSITGYQVGRSPVFRNRLRSLPEESFSVMRLVGRRKRGRNSGASMGLSVVETSLAGSHLVRSHLVRSHLVRSHLVGSHLVGAPLGGWSFSEEQGAVRSVDVNPKAEKKLRKEGGIPRARSLSPRKRRKVQAVGAVGSVDIKPKAEKNIEVVEKDRKSVEISCSGRISPSKRVRVETVDAIAMGNLKLDSPKRAKVFR